MKKVLSILFLLLIITGCSLGKDMTNTPTKKVEEYLNNYNTLDTSVLERLDSIVDLEDTFTDIQKDSYRDLLKKHYQDMTYTIKEETVNGDKATVETEIEVKDYTKAIKEAESYKTTNEDKLTDDKGVFSDEKYNDYRLDLLKKSEDKVKYTIYFSLTKDSNGKWNLDDLTDAEEDKILGIYEY